LLSLNQQGWAQGSFVEAEARQGSNVLNRGKAETDSSRPRQGRLNSTQGRGETEWNRRCLCRFDIMHNCTCIVVTFLALWSMAFINEKHYREVSFKKSMSNTRPRQKL